MSGRLIDMIGKRFRRLTVIKRMPNAKNGEAKWLCKCECGKETIVPGGALRNGHTKSCGCLQRDLMSGINKKRSFALGIANMRKVMKNYKWQAKKRKLKWDLTEKQFKEVTQQNCYYCRVKPKQIENRPFLNGAYVYNGIDRLDNTKGYTVDNIVSCCKQCNFAKRKYTLQEFKDWIKQVYNNLN